MLMACGESQEERQLRRARDLRDAPYPIQTHADCAPGSRRGAAGFGDARYTTQHLRYTLVTPRNYDAARAHPLLVVFAPAKISRHEVERVTGFTAPSTAAGFIVVYADHVALGSETTRALGEIAADVAATWCVDESRIFHAGHSDGGTVSHMLAVMPDTSRQIAGIAPSGAGVRASDLEVYGCPQPRAVMVSHGAEDKQFPGWGAETARWWARCNRCSTVSVRDAQGCQAFQGCAPGAPTRFCEIPGGHARWPGNAEAVVAFFRDLPAGTATKQ